MLPGGRRKLNGRTALVGGWMLPAFMGCIKFNDLFYLFRTFQSYFVCFNKIDFIAAARCGFVGASVIASIKGLISWFPAV